MIHTFYIQGMHCAGCTTRVRDLLSTISEVRVVRIERDAERVMVEADNAISQEEVLRRCSAVFVDTRYSLSLEKKAFIPQWQEFRFAIPFTLGFIALFIVLQKLGLVNLITADKVSLPVAFGIGLVASVSSCLAVVGGLLLSISAQYAKEGEKKTPQIYFHAGRLISFFVLGGIIGLIGSAFTLGGIMTLILGVLVGLVMLSLGINLLDIFPWATRFQPRMPAFLTNVTSRVKTLEHSIAPFLIGLSTFFLPCGFTQSMQVYSLSTGSFVIGALTMTAFALGTFPVLALISFTSVELGRGKWSGVFFKTAGLLVILFGMMNIINSFAGAGIIPPLFGF